MIGAAVKGPFSSDPRQLTPMEASMFGASCPIAWPALVASFFMCKDNPHTLMVARLAYRAEQRKLGDGANPIFTNAYASACRGSDDPVMMDYAVANGLL
jgi:hypothetical protein